MEDEEYFFNTFEACDIDCNNYMALGDLNGDSTINVIDYISVIQAKTPQSIAKTLPQRFLTDII